VHGAASGRNLPAGEYVAIRVIDNGTGMTPEVMRRAFEPLFTTKAKGMGTGLGLSMMYGFATQSGGQLHLYSEPGHGSTVCLYLPRRQGAEGVAEPPAPLDPGSRFGHGRTVLIVDDEETVRKLVVDGLQDHGYASIVAEDAFTGFKILQSNPDVDILISDVGLPGGMNGLQLAAAAKAIRPTLKVLFITGYAESALVNKGPLDPGIRVLTKPFSLHNLSSTIRDILSVSG
jgi:CheY-like chemotaxis protein